MKHLEHRRHSIRHKPGVHLNQDGVNLAKEIGQSMRHFDYVVTSYIERAWETAMVMGYAVDEFRPELSVFGDKMNDKLLHETTFQGLAKYVTFDMHVRKYAEFQLGFLREVMDKVQDGHSVLIISHGYIIDVPLIMMFQTRIIQAGERFLATVRDIGSSMRMKHSKILNC